MVNKCPYCNYKFGFPNKDMMQCRKTALPTGSTVRAFNIKCPNCENTIRIEVNYDLKKVIKNER